MPICTTCSQPISSLYLTLGNTQHIVLASCDNCHSIADPYLEYDVAIVMIDLILVKPKAYRHLLYNRPCKTLTNRWIILLKRYLAFLLVDSYIRWFYLCIQPTDLIVHSLSLPSSKLQIICQKSSMIQIVKSYLFLLFFTFLESISFHLPLSFFTFLFVRLPSLKSNHHHHHPSSKGILSLELPWTAILLSQLNTTLLLCILLLWDSKTPSPSSSSSSSFSPLDSFASFLISTLSFYSITWTIRVILAGLSAGVAMGVVIPHQPIVSTLILSLAWSIQIAVALGIRNWIMTG